MLVIKAYDESSEIFLFELIASLFNEKNNVNILFAINSIIDFHCIQYLYENKLNHFE